MAAATEPPVTPSSWAETASGSPAITTPPLAVQQGGFPVGSPVGPVVGMFNWAMNFVFNGVRAWKQRGMPLWDAAETNYVPGSILRSTDGNFYFLKVGGTATTGLAPQSDATNWTNPFASVATTTYTGNPVGVESPDTGPVVGGAPVLTVPTSGLVQPWKVLADWVAFFAQLYNVPSAYYGDGSDGALTVSSGTTTITSPKNYTNVTVSAGAVLIIDKALVRIQGTLTVASGGLIHYNGASSPNGDGRAAYGNDPLVGGSGFAAGLGGGASGGLAPPHGISASWSPVAGQGFTLAGSAAGGSGGTGCNSAGSGSSTPGGGGGAAGTALPMFPAAVLYQTGFVLGRTTAGGTQENLNLPDSTRIIPVATLVALRGGSGGGGGAGAGGPSGGDTDTNPPNPNGWGWTTGGPGGGGAGGGVVIIFARKINLGAADLIKALGGNGGNATNNTIHSGQAQGGGGGGGGGRVHLYYGQNLGSFGLTSACVAGGTGGTAVNGGTAGANGSTGVFQFLQLPL